MSDLATPSSGESAPAPVSEAPAAPAPAEGASKGAEAKAAPSPREAFRKALAQVSAASSETNQAAAVLKEGAGADETLKADAEKGLNEAADAERAAHEASERAKRGWETRRENQAKAETEAKQAETIQTTAKETAKAVAEAVKPAPAEQQKAATESKFKDAPKRFVLNDKADWDKVPESVRSEIDRSFRNLEEGIAKHKEGADRWSKLEAFEKRSQEVYKQPIDKTLENYVQLDELLQTDMLAGLEQIVGRATWKDENGKSHPYTLKQIAQYVIEQEGIERFDSENNELKRELSALRREMAEIKNGWSERAKQESEQRTKSVEQQIADFAKAHDRFDELFPAIEEELHNPRFAAGLDPIARLQKAYEKAERLNPAPSLSPPAPEIPASDPEAQRRKGQASVSGSPGNGSAPASKRPAPQSIRDAIRMGMSQAGVR